MYVDKPISPSSGSQASMGLAGHSKGQWERLWGDIGLVPLGADQSPVSRSSAYYHLRSKQVPLSLLLHANF